MEYLEGFLSLLVGLIGAALMGVFFVVKALFLCLYYLTGQLIGLAFPKLRYRFRLRWLLRHVDREKNQKLHTGLFRTVELKGDASDRLFKSVKNGMKTYRQQKKRRRALKDQAVLGDIFAKYDALYLTLLKQFWTASASVDWKKVDIYNKSGNPAFSNMEIAANGLETLLSEHEKTLDHASGTALDAASERQDIEQEMAFLQNFNAAQDEILTQQAEENRTQMMQ